MLTITIKARPDVWDPETETFDSLDRDWTIQLEHSLISIAKWEAIYKKPYLSEDTKKTTEEVLEYIKCMTITPNVDPHAYKFLSKENVEDIEKYINDPRTATWFADDHRPGGGRSKMRKEILTSELIYYYMTTNGISWEAQKWHINRLLTLIRVHGVKDEGGAKMSKKDIINRNSALNKARRMALGSKG